jgi:hypothetical protein
MKYDSGYITPRIRWVKLDKRNKMVEHYSHRVTVRGDHLTCVKVEKWFKENLDFDPYTFWGPQYASMYSEGPYVKPRVYKKRETFTRYHMYLQEQDLVYFMLGYQQ